MLCSDKSLTYLAGIGYNVIRHPDPTFAPLKLLGQQGGEFMLLGSLDQLITPTANQLPSVTASQPAAEVNGQRSSSLKIDLGVSVLGSFIGAMGGGNLGALAAYTDATSIEFQYQDVFVDSVVPIDIGAYLKASSVDKDNLILTQYVHGNGKLFILTKVIKSDKFTVKFTKSSGSDASVQVPVLQGAIGGNISLATTGGSNATVTFQGKTSLPFGFQCFQVGVRDGVLTLLSTKAGNVFGLGVGDVAQPDLQPASSPAILITGLLEVRTR